MFLPVYMEALFVFHYSSTWLFGSWVDSRPALRVAGFAGDDTARAVFLGCIRAQDAWHFG